MNRLRVVAWGLLLFWTVMDTHLQGQSFQLNTRKFTTTEGLSHNTVYSILQDKEGFLWLGTKYGLNRFDGNEFIWFTRQTHGLHANQVSRLFQASDHRLWLIERQENLHDTLFTSLELFDPHIQQSQSLEEILQEPPPFLFQEIKWIEALADGPLLINTPQGTYLLHDKRGLRKTGIPEGFQLIKAFGEKDIWGILQRQLVQVDTAGKIQLHFQLNDAQQVYQLEKDHHQKYWAVVSAFSPRHGNLDAGEIWLIDQGQKMDTPFSFTFYSPYEFYLLPRGSDSEVFLFYQRQFQVWNDSLQKMTSIPEFFGNRGKNELDVFMEDKQGVLWYGHRDGLWAIQRKQSPFQQLLKGEDNNMFPTRGIGQQGNQLYINSMKDCIALDLSSGQTTSYIASHRQFDLFRAFAMYTTPRGELWTANDQLYQLDSQAKFMNSIALHEFKGDRIWSFFQDKEETWWLAEGEDKLYYFNEKIHTKPVLFTQYNGFESILNARKWHMAEDDHGIWIASEDGLYLLDTKKGIVARYAEREKGANFLPAKIFNHIYIDKEGIMWLSTGDAGLIRIAADSLGAGQNHRYQQLTRSQGLPSNELYACLEDHAAHLWISTANGLVQLNKQTLKFSTYFEEQGITHNEFNRLSYFKAPSGRMYFGGLNGVNSFDPKDFYRNKPYDPKLKISKILLFSGKENRLLDLTYGLSAQNQLDYYPGDKYLKLQFSLQDYFYSDKINYSYKIDGLQQNWADMSGNELQLSGLPYGRYSLHVRAQGPDQRFSEREASLEIHVHWPFYLKGWFILLALLALGLTIWQVIYWRIKSLQRRQQLLERIVRERTQKIMEDKLTMEKQAAELQELNEIKSRFFANISHELRTPLTLILGPLARMLRRRRLEAEDQRTLQLMQNNGQQLLRRINELLDLSRLDAKKLEVQQEALSLMPFLRQMLAGFEGVANLKKIDLTLDFQPDTALRILTDKDKLEKILSNFLSNAVKFTPEGGKIRLMVRAFVSSKVGHPEPSNPRTHELANFLFSISDTGPGIAPEELEKVFDRFFQSKNTDQAGGTGIGLSLAKELAELLGGKVGVESEKGEGATFYLEIPLQEVGAPAKAELETAEVLAIPIENTSPVNPGAKPKATILLAEDHPDMQKYICEVLSDYEVIPTANGAEALQKLKARNPKPGTIPPDHLRHHDACHGRHGTAFQAESRQRF